MTAEGDLCGQNFCESLADPENKCSSGEVPADLTGRRCDVSQLKRLFRERSKEEEEECSSPGSERISDWI